MRPGFRGGFLLCVVTACALAGTASRASAGPVEQLVQLAIHPRDPNTMLVRYTEGGGGMLRTHDGGRSWRLACDSMQLDPQTRSGATVIAGDGSTWMGAFDGLWHDDGHDCGWQREHSLDGKWIGDVINHPTDPDVVFAVTSVASHMDEHVQNGVLRRDVSGVWSDVGVKDELLPTRLLVAEHGSGLRMYVSAIKGQTMPSDGGVSHSIYVVRVSDDDGATWQEFPVDDTAGSFRLQAVDPTNPDRIVATISRYADNNGNGGEDSILVSSDRGEHFAEYLKITEIGGLTFAPDGRLWIGDKGESTNPRAPNGLWFAPSLDVPATRLALGDYPVQCLGYNLANDTLYACQHWIFGTVDKDSGELSSLLNLRDVQDFVQCDGVDPVAACDMQLCGAYCGYGHFGVAPVCQVYDTPTCGKAVAAAEAELGMPAAPDVPPPAQSPSPDDAASSSANLHDVQGATSAPQRKSRDAGCSVAALGANRARGVLGFGAAMLLIQVLERARRRRTTR